MRRRKTAAGPSVGITAQTLGETLPRLVPVAGATGRQPPGEQSARFLPCGGKASGRCDDLADGDGFDLSGPGKYRSRPSTSF
jgi:hypothetical protein